MPFTKLHTFAPLPQTTRGQPVKLEADPKGKNFLYTNGKTVFIRNLENPALATTYSGHTAQATVATYSPSGYYIASGDVAGNVRIWDTVGEEQILKSEIKPISGRITDIAWDSESKRVIAVGEGKERFGHAFAFDTLSSVGEITGHSKVINSVSIRQQRPFRAVTASDDMSVVFYHGVPFKFNKVIRDHSRFVHTVKFSPNGDLFASAGADGKIFLYDGKTGDKIQELTSDQAHTGGIFAASWSTCSKYLLTSSADSTAKIWDIEAKSVINTFDFASGSSHDEQQVGNLWSEGNLLSVALSGEIRYLDKNSGSIARSIHGHSKATTSLTSTKNDTLFTGSYDGRVCAWQYGTEQDKTLPQPLKGEQHTNQITSMVAQGDTLFSAGMDDVIRVGKATDQAYNGTSIAVGSQPKSVSISNDETLVVAAGSNVQIYDKQQKKIGVISDLDFNPTAVGINANGKTIVVGGQDGKSRVYRHENGKVTLQHTLENNRGIISAIAVNPKQELVAIGDSVGKIFVYDLESGKSVISQWVYHNARITSINWSECGVFAVSGSLDTNIYVWNREKPLKKAVVKNSHVDAVNDVQFLNSKDGKLTVASVGQDGALKIWAVDPVV
ncbi:WD40-repeat-containing domain protein [Umbelopsis sp. PMI_123]|nr:WD40-repeat-containing domain protein [Umbelopsis sp. PMI_123]